MVRQLLIFLSKYLGGSYLRQFSFVDVKITSVGRSSHFNSGHAF